MYYCISYVAYHIIYSFAYNSGCKSKNHQLYWQQGTYCHVKVEEMKLVNIKHGIIFINVLTDHSYAYY